MADDEEEEDHHDEVQATPITDQAEVNAPRTVSDPQDNSRSISPWPAESSDDACLKAICVKQKTRLEELEAETVKFRRLLSLAKRSIAKGKEEMGHKDQILEQLVIEKQELLTQVELLKQREKNTKVEDDKDLAMSGYDLRRILIRIELQEEIHCYLEYSNTDQETLVPKYRWKKFQAQAQLSDFIRKTSGEPLTLPPISLSPFEAEEVREQTKVEIDRIKEEFRRYRVRAEITRKQKDAALQKAQANSISRRQEEIADGSQSSSSKLSVAQAQAQIKKLTQSQLALLEEARQSRERTDKLERENLKLAGRAGETAIAVQWRERYEHVVQERDSLLATTRQSSIVESHQDFIPSFPMSNIIETTRIIQEDDLSLEKLKREYSLYRKHTLEVVEEKDQWIEKAREKLNRVGISFELPSRLLRPRKLSSSSPSLAVDHEQTQYLKNVMLKYLCTTQMEVKEHMEKAIATVLKFTPDELLAIHAQKQQQQQAQQWSLW